MKMNKKTAGVAAILTGAVVGGALLYSARKDEAAAFDPSDIEEAVEECVADEDCVADAE